MVVHVRLALRQRPVVEIRRILEVPSRCRRRPVPRRACAWRSRAARPSASGSRPEWRAPGRTARAARSRRPARPPAPRPGAAGRGAAPASGRWWHRAADAQGRRTPPAAVPAGQRAPSRRRCARSAAAPARPMPISRSRLRTGAGTCVISYRRGSRCWTCRPTAGTLPGRTTRCSAAAAAAPRPAPCPRGCDRPGSHPSRRAPAPALPAGLASCRRSNALATTWVSRARTSGRSP